MTNGNSSPIWKQQLVRSLHLSGSKNDSKYMQVASINAKNTPSVRTMVFRGFCIEKPSDIFVVTDTRSEKFDEISQNGSIQVCWYFSKTREQYRLSAHGIIERDIKILEDYWQRLSSSAQKSFYSAPPKAIKTDSDIKFKSTPNLLSEPIIRPQTFSLIRIQVWQSDYLDLKAKPHDRVIETLTNGNWCATNVNA